MSPGLMVEADGLAGAGDDVLEVVLEPPQAAVIRAAAESAMSFDVAFTVNHHGPWWSRFHLESHLLRRCADEKAPAPGRTGAGAFVLASAVT
jgi:hypothetical protein